MSTTAAICSLLRSLRITCSFCYRQNIFWRSFMLMLRKQIVATWQRQPSGIHAAHRASGLEGCWLRDFGVAVCVVATTLRESHVVLRCNLRHSDL
eukprot:6208817-Pleurochrysis_carterae.AAC.1